MAVVAVVAADVDLPLPPGPLASPPLATAEPPVWFDATEVAACGVAPAPLSGTSNFSRLPTPKPSLTALSLPSSSSNSSTGRESSRLKYFALRSWAVLKPLSRLSVARPRNVSVFLAKKPASLVHLRALDRLSDRARARRWCW